MQHGTSLIWPASLGCYPSPMSRRVTSRVPPGTHDLPGLARFWSQALGWRILSGRERAIVTGPTRTRRPAGVCASYRSHDGQAPHAARPDQQRRRPRAGDRPPSCPRARRADIGQAGAESWTVLANPEGNEFRVVRPKEALIR
jgi:hypothetical protein